MKGQTMVDSLMLVLAFSVVIVTISVISSPETIRSQHLRYSSDIHQAGLRVVTEKYVDFRDMSNVSMLKARVVDALVFHACLADGTDKEMLGQAVYDEINSSLYMINKGKRHYILDTGIMRVYDNKSSVCLENIPLASQDVNVTCGTGEVVVMRIVYGTWGIHEDPPEGC